MEFTVKDLIEDNIRAIVEDEEAVSVKELNGDTVTVYEVKVAKGDLGKVIGKGGRVAMAMRTLLQAMSAKEKRTLFLEIIDD